jgi:hypothetical protein
MSSPKHELRANVQRAVDAATQFLTAHQDDDGYWRDYDLEPGRAEAWITGCVGYALSQNIPIAQSRQTALHRAAETLLAAQRPGGWGYNRRTACDADSTSWVIRFLAQLGTLNEGSVLSLLSRYVTVTGAVRTFDSPDRFGSWAMEHNEVTPLVGLALLASGERGPVAQIRASVLSSWIAGYGWKPFWWRSGVYATAQNLNFLLFSGGIPKYLAADERARLLHAPMPESAFETAQQLAVALHLDAYSEVLRFGERLLGLQSSDGGWLSWPGLLVRHQRDPSHFEMFHDDRRLLSTAMAVIALTLWLRPRPIASANEIVHRSRDHDTNQENPW